MTIRSAKDLVAEAGARVKTITAAEAASLVGSTDSVFVDVREANELATSGTVAGAIHVPRGVLEFQADPASPAHKAELDPAKRLVLFCASGGRSTLAARALADMGFPRRRLGRGWVFRAGEGRGADGPDLGDRRILPKARSRRRQYRAGSMHPPVGHIKRERRGHSSHRPQIRRTA